MDDKKTSIYSKSYNLYAAIQELKGFLPEGLQSHYDKQFSAIYQIYDSLSNANHDESVSELIVEASKLWKAAIPLATRLADTADEKIRTKAIEVQNLADFLKAIMKDGSNDEGNEYTEQALTLITRLNQAEREVGFLNERLNNQDQMVIRLDPKVKNLAADLTKIADEITGKFNSKLAKLDISLGHAAASVIASDYGKSAEIEARAADSMRNGSVGCLVGILFLLIYCLVETTQLQFDWQTTLLRLAIAAFLSGPAAYLARESSKHRAQHYHFKQMSLDLKTLAPYLADLPVPDQQKIKAATVTRLFSGHSARQGSSDSFPFTPKLLTELIKAVGNSRGRN